MIPLAVQAKCLCVAGWCRLSWWASNYLAPVLIRSVRSATVAKLRLMLAAFALHVAPFVAELAKDVRDAIMYCSILYQTPTAVTLLITTPCITIIPLTMKTTNDAFISPLCSRSLKVWVFDSHLTWAGIITPLFSAWLSTLIFCSFSVPLPMYLTNKKVWIFSLFYNSFPSTSMTPWSTDLATCIMKSL